MSDYTEFVKCPFCPFRLDRRSWCQMPPWMAKQWHLRMARHIHAKHVRKPRKGTR